MKKRIFTIIMLLTLVLSVFSLSSSALFIENDSLIEKEYALIIGYGAGSITISKNAVDMKNTLLRYGWKEDNIKSILSFAATKNNILNAITGWLDDKEGVNDRVFIYFSIHGGYVDEDGFSYYEELDEPDNKEEFILPVEFTLRHPSYPFTPFGCDRSLLIADEELNEAINELESNNIIIIFDSCYSGGMIDGDMDLAKPGRIVLTSSQASTPSWFNRYKMNAYFTKYLLKGFQGEADKTDNGGNNNGYVSVQEAFNYAKSRTTQDVYDRWGFSQEPQIYDGYCSEIEFIDLSKETKSKEIHKKSNMKLSSLLNQLLNQLKISNN